MGSSFAKKHAPTSRLSEGRAELHIPADRALRIVAVADTHSRPHPSSARWIAREKPDAIVHAGDIGDLHVLDELEQIAPVIAIRGNIDTHAAKIPDAVTIDLRAGDATHFKILLLHIAVYGPRLRADAARLAVKNEASLVVCGHSHVPFVGRDRGLLVFNPGSIGPRRFDLPIVFGLLEVGPNGLQMSHIDCASGERWLPPAGVG